MQELTSDFKGRPRYMWIGWGINIASFIALLIALIADSITSVSFRIGSTATFSGSSKTGACGWKTFAVVGSGFQSQSYDICSQDTPCSSTKEAGQVWIAFGILSSLSNAVLFYFFAADYFAGVWGSKPFTHYLLALTIILEILMLIGWSAPEQCSSSALWQLLNASNISSFSSNGGASIGFASIAVILNGILIGIITFVYLQAGKFPHGEPREIPVQLDFAFFRSNETQPKPKVINSNPNPNPNTNSNPNPNPSKPNYAPQPPQKEASPPPQKEASPPPVPPSAVKSNGPVIGGQPIAVKNFGPKPNNPPPAPTKNDRPKGAVPIPGKKPIGPPPVPGSS